MDELTLSHFYSAWGESFSDAVPQSLDSNIIDADDIIFRAFGRSLHPREFHALTEDDIARIQRAANEWFETDIVQVSEIREAVRVVCLRWPLEDLRD